MDIVDKEIDEAVARQEKRIVKEIGELFERKAVLTNDQTSIRYAHDIAQKQKVNYGSALSLIFWLDELLEIYPEDKKQARLNAKARQRLIVLGRLIKIAGGQRGLWFCCCKLPSYAVKNFISLLDMSDSWKEKKSGHTVTS